MRSRAALAVVVAASMSLLACGSDSSPAITDPEETNIPAVGNQPNSFAFVVLARDLTLDRIDAVSFTSDSTSVGLTVMGYEGGTGTLEVFDATDAAILTRQLGANVAEGTTIPLAARPARVRIRFAGYSGVVAIGVHAD